MTRSIKALRSAAILAALALPAVASAQDTSSTGSRVTRDSASARNMNGVRFDASQAITLTGVTIARIDSSGATDGTMNSAGTTGPVLSAIVRSGTDSMRVMLAPAEFLKAKQLTLSAGDVINVKGVRIAASASAQSAGAAGSMVGGATGTTTTTTTTTAGSMGASGTNSATMTILATEIGKGSTTVLLRDKTTGEPVWGMMGAEAARNRAMTPPPLGKDTSRTTPPVRMP